MKYYIYVMKSVLCSKQYVGMTNNPRKRLKSHLNSEKLKWYKLTKFGRAVKRYGAKSFTMRIIAETEDVDEAMKIESLWIKRLGSKRVWNSNTGGAYSGKHQKAKPFLRKTSNETRRKRREALRQKSKRVR